MHVSVAGATGAVGRPNELRVLGVGTVVADGLDASAMTEAVVRAEPDAIVHQMIALAGKPDMRRFDRWFATTNELRTRGTDILLAAARKVQVEQFVAQGYTGWTNPTTGGRVKDEAGGFISDPPRCRARPWRRSAISRRRAHRRAARDRPARRQPLRARRGPVVGSERLCADVRRLPVARRQAPRRIQPMSLRCWEGRCWSAQDDRRKDQAWDRQ